MKSKVLVSLLIASIMLFTLAAPALAKPLKLRLIDAATGTGQASVRQNKDGHLIVSVSLRGATHDETYKIALQYLGSSYAEIGTLTTNSRGAGRVKIIDTEIGKYSGAEWIRVWVVTGNPPYTGTAWYNTQQTFPVDFP